MTNVGTDNPQPRTFQSKRSIFASLLLAHMLGFALTIVPCIVFFGIAYPALIVGLLAGGRAARIGITIDDEGVVVRNYFRTRRFRYEESLIMGRCSMTVPVVSSGAIRRVLGIRAAGETTYFPVQATAWADRPLRTKIEYALRLHGVGGGTRRRAGGRPVD